MSSSVRRTYSSRSRLSVPSSPPSTPPSSPPPPSFKRKRPFEDAFSITNAPPVKKLAKTTIKPKPKYKSGDSTKPKQKSLTQLHFSLDTSILRTCPLCDLTYTKGAPDDEILHKAHCSRVVKGMEWGKEEEKERIKAGVEEVASGVRLKNGKKGRIICFKADVGGKIGSKLTTLLTTINLALSSPSLTLTVLQSSKVYLFLLPSITGVPHREKIAGCVIAQRISTAMAIASPLESESSHNLISVDPSTSLFCYPAPLPTYLGIPRIFVPSTHRRQGIACHLLDTAAQTFVHGYPLDPAKGEIAFTQPTGAGGGVMKAWGKGGVRIYEE